MCISALLLCARASNPMAPRLQLPQNFRVRTFGSSRNTNGLGKYVMPTASVTHISETRLEVSVSQPSPRDCPTSEVTVVSPVAGSASDCDGPSVGKRSRSVAAATRRKKTKIPAATTITRRWQEVWACKFAWAEGDFNTDGDLVGVICRSCTSITGRRKVMVPKLDNLEKHEGKRTCQEDGVPEPHLKKGDVFIKRDCRHLQFCKLWAGRKQVGTVADQLLASLEGDMKKKGVQFATIFHILSHGRPMCDYERQQQLLRQVKVKNLPRKHWSESTGWEMSEHLHASVLAALKGVVQAARIISISVDEVTAVDNTSWVGVHVYAMESWERVPHLLHLSCVFESGTADHLTNVIMHALMGEGGLSREEIASKLVCFGADGVSTFQGPKTGVTTQIREKWAPFLIGASCVSHRVNLVVETISKFPMVSRLEGLFQSIYSYFCRSNKRHAELQRLADLMETKGNKMVRNVDTRWISMRSPAARVMSEYWTLLVKMGSDMTPAPGHRPYAGAVENFDILADIELVLSLACFIPLLNAVHSLIKLSQARDIFICDFLQAVKLCQGELGRMFLNASTSYSKADFQRYSELTSLSCTEIPLMWRPLPGDSGIFHLMFEFEHIHEFARCHDKQSGNHLFVTHEEFNRLQDNIERQFSAVVDSVEIAQCLSDELDRRFPQQELLDAFGIIYPQYWRQDGADESFVQHLKVLKDFYATARALSKGQPFTVPEMLSASNLDNQAGLFKITMKANADVACGPPFHSNPVIKLWQKLSQSRHLTKLISEYFKVAEIGCCMVLGLVEDERCFSTLKFLKSCQRNRLGKHLPLVVRMFGQKYFSLDNFPYKDAIESWKSAIKIGRQGDV